MSSARKCYQLNVLIVVIVWDVTDKYSLNNITTLHHPHIKQTNKSLEEKVMPKNVICKNCGGIAIIGNVCTTCQSCGASVDPNTGEPYRDNGKVVLSSSFGGDI